jgi:hypothetical protein
MLRAHIKAVEDHLLAISKVPANSGHSLHKGTPREAFVKEFLQGHLSEKVAIGTGEIIDADSLPGQQRNQIDIVVYKRDYPRLQFGGGVSGFLVESVVATVEIKSTLSKEDLRSSMLAARNVKLLKPNLINSMTSGYQPPTVLSYVVAYDGPAKMKTVHGWLKEISVSDGIEFPELPGDPNLRLAVASPSVDAVFVLGKGFLQFGNAYTSFFQEAALAKDAEVKWALVDTADINLLLLFLNLTAAVSGTSISWLNQFAYLKSVTVEDLSHAS